MNKEGRCKNISYGLAAGSGLVGGTLLSLGYYYECDAMKYTGYILTVGLGLTALIYDIVGNAKIAKGGKLMKNVYIDEKGFTIRF